MVKEIPPHVPRFEIYGTPHLTALALTAAAVWFLSRRAKQGAPAASKMPGIALAAITLSHFVFGAWSCVDLDYDFAPPLHLCDFAAFAGVAAMLTRKPIFCELTYFWGMAGTIQGLLTPALRIGFPEPAFFAFFALHCGVVAMALYLVIGLRFVPRPGAPLRAFLWTQAYVAVAALGGWLFDENYGFLREKPENGSLLDLLGPWPYYIISLELLALALYSLLYLPFWRRNRSAGAAAAGNA